MKVLLIVSALVVGGSVAVLFVSRAATITEEERTVCALAIKQMHDFDVSRLRRLTYRVNVGTNGRRVEIAYPGDYNRPDFICIKSGTDVLILRSGESPSTTRPQGSTAALGLGVWVDNAKMPGMVA